MKHLQALKAHSLFCANHYFFPYHFKLLCLYFSFPFSSKKKEKEMKSKRVAKICLVFLKKKRRE
jgi:hypothetical protein